MIPEWLPQESRVLNVFLRGGPQTCTEVAKVLGVWAPTVHSHVHTLVLEGVLVEVGRIGPRRAVVWGVRGAPQEDA